MLGSGYVEERLLSGLPFRTVRVKKTHDVFTALAFVRRRVGCTANATALISGLHCDFGLTRVDLFNFVNTVSLSTTPWVVTYEHYLPRWNWHSPLGWRRLAAPSCKKIIAISQWAQRFQEHLLAGHPALADDVHPKMCVITPGQQPLIARYDDKVLEPHRITFAFVGGDFFRKGGMEVLEAFSQLLDEQLPVHLTVVSSLTYGDYASRTTRADLDRAKGLIARMGPNVTHFWSLDNQQVLQLFARSHVALLPTYDDTYGFSVLEGQAAGCPAITTDCCALPEFNDDLTGWLIQVPKDTLGISLHDTPEHRAQLSRCVRENLVRIVRDICADPSIIRIKGERAFARIRQERSLEHRVGLLEEIYRGALG
jgi:glycosyltransferase involved in cell wall biosynthesis